MVQQSTLAGFVVILGSVPSTYTVCNCSSRRSKILLFWPPQTPGTLVYSHTCKAKHSYTWDKIKHEIYSWCGNYKVRLYLREKTMKTLNIVSPWDDYSPSCKCSSIHSWTVLPLKQPCCCWARLHYLRHSSLFAFFLFLFLFFYFFFL